MSQVQDVKAANDIISIIGEKLPLQKSGAYYKGLCPFHNEKTPSFFVSEVLQRFQCFGCGAGGDVFEFLIRYDSMTFYEALETLAARAGITLRHEFKTQEDEDREKLLAVLELAKDYYHYLLTEHKVGQSARDYLLKRGIRSESIKLFSLGYALPKWDGLIRYLHHKKKYPMEILLKAGLVISKSQTRHYDRFRDRIIFPLRNHRGQVVGFSGRSLDPDVKEAKYINSPETSVYHKGKMLYGYSELRRQLAVAKSVIVTEGEFDVISSTQAEVNNVVAIKGSAFTPDHAQLISRVANNVILALDADAAGLEATRRALNVLKPFELELKVVPVGEGKDPDDWARQNPKTFRQALKQAMSAYDFLIDLAVKTYGVTTAAGKKQIIKELAADLWQIESNVEKEFYVKKLAQVLGTQPSLLLADLRHFAEKIAKPKSSTEREGQPPLAAPAQSRSARLEHYLLFLLLRSKAERLAELYQSIAQLNFTFPPLKALVAEIKKDLATSSKIANISALSARLPADLQQLLMQIFVDKDFMLVLETGKETQEWQLTVDKLKQELKMLERKNLSDKIAQLETKVPLTKDEEKQLASYLEEIAKQN